MVRPIKSGTILIPCVLVIIAAFTFVFSETAKGEVGPYFVSEWPLSWEDSRKYCQIINKTLVTVESVRKDQELLEYFGSGGNYELPGNVWTAGKERSEGVWNWDTGADDPATRPFYHTRWFVGQPDDLTAFNCVYLANSALLYWRDANCSAPMYFICDN